MPPDVPDANRPSLVRQLLRGIGARTGSSRTRRAGTERAKATVAPTGRPWAPILLATLLALAPLLTIAGAAVAERRTRAQIAGLQREAEPILRAAEDVQAGRSRLRTLIGRPTLGRTLDALARALPSEATLVRTERRQDGALRIEVAAPDPDRLRAALRRDAATASLRDAGQRRGEGVMIVTFEGEPR